MSYRDYYTILGVEQTASAEQIHHAYRKLARKYHPDVTTVSNAEEYFKAVGEAYGVLRDDRKRALYDRYGESWNAVQEGRAPQPDVERVRVDFSKEGFHPERFEDSRSVFDMFIKNGFGQQGGTGGGGEWKIAGTDHELALALTLEEAFKGGEREIWLRDPNTGNEQHLKIHVPAGVQSNGRVRLAGQGGKGRGGGQDGDLYLHIHIEPHSVFRLEKGNLHITLPLSPWEAALGTTVDLKTLEETVRLKIPSGSSTGRKIRLRNKGYFKSITQRGDLFAEVRVDVPLKLTAIERELLEKLKRVSEFQPRADHCDLL